MRKLASKVGQRIRSHRLRMNMSQEELAERCGLHPTYIGQLERGEKNATLESIDRVARGLSVSLGSLFENVSGEDESSGYPMQAYLLVMSENEKNQERLVNILRNVIDYGKK